MTISFREIQQKHFINFKIDLLFGGNAQPVDPPDDPEENPPDNP